jgi:cytochrome P450
MGFVVFKPPPSDHSQENRTIIFAGHETTAKSATWALYQLAQHPEIQSRLRAEILETRAKAQSRGDTDIAVSDFENMPYTIAVMKETFRLHPIIGALARTAVKDDIVPLYTPLTTISGKIIKEISIPKGTIVFASIHGYHL